MLVQVDVSEMFMWQLHVSRPSLSTLTTEAGSQSSAHFHGSHGDKTHWASNNIILSRDSVAIY
eukprot:2357912-Amphidinium_carterae.2